MSIGKFIVLEGIDSCGKSSQIKLLHKKFVKNNIPVISTREPSNGPIGRLIRREYLSGKRSDNGGIINKLCEVDRMDHVLNEKDGIIKYLKQGINVLCDRYFLSSMAYSLYNKIDIDESLFNQKALDIFNTFINNQGIKPDLIVYINIDPKEAVQRLSKRNKLSIYENSIAKLQKIHKSYLKVIDLVLSNKLCTLVSIDGDDTKSSVLEDIWSHVKVLINK